MLHIYIIFYVMLCCFIHSMSYIHDINSRYMCVMNECKCMATVREMEVGTLNLTTIHMQLEKTHVCACQDSGK